MEPANIRDVVLQLKKRGLIRAQKDATDKRLTLWSLTRAGLSLFEIIRLLQIESDCKNSGTFWSNRTGAADQSAASCWRWLIV